MTFWGANSPPAAHVFGVIPSQTFQLGSLRKLKPRSVGVKGDCQKRKWKNSMPKKPSRHQWNHFCCLLPTSGCFCLFHV